MAQTYHKCENHAGCPLRAGCSTCRL